LGGDFEDDCRVFFLGSTEPPTSQLLVGEKLLQILAGPLALFQRPFDLADLLLQASNATTIALVEKIEDLDLGVHVFPLRLLELRE
jgi:hypothetical protein